MQVVLEQKESSSESHSYSSKGGSSKIDGTHVDAEGPSTPELSKQATRSAREARDKASGNESSSVTKNSSSSSSSQYNSQSNNSQSNNGSSSSDAKKEIKQQASNAKGAVEDAGDSVKKTAEQAQRKITSN